MPSEFKIANLCLEWCIELPSIGSPRESPVFLLKDNECFFRFIVEKPGPTWWCNLYLELKSKGTAFKPCHGNLQVGFKNEQTLSLDKKNFTISEPGIKEIWYVKVEYLQSKLPPDYMTGNWIKFLFRFDDIDESLLSINKEIEKQPAAITGLQPLQESQKSSDTGINIHLEALSRDLSKLLDETSNCNVRITCEDQTFNAHKNILGMRSAVFSAMLQSDMVEGETGLIKVEDFSAPVFQSFLRYLYSGTLPELKIETAKQFYEIADKYAVEELKQACSEFLIKNLSGSNACEILVLADHHSDENFRNNVISYILSEKIPEEDECWFDFCKSYPILAIEVLNLYVRKKRSN